jgi:hypothetical protein
MCLETRLRKSSARRPNLQALFLKVNYDVSKVIVPKSAVSWVWLQTKCVLLQTGYGCLIHNTFSNQFDGLVGSYPACLLLLEISSGTHEDLPMTEFDGRPDLLLLLSRGVKILWIQP